MTDLKPPITDAHEPAEDDEEYSEESVNRQENQGDRALLRRLLDHRPDNLKLEAIGKGVDKVIFGVVAALTIAFVIWGFVGTESLSSASTTALGWVMSATGWAFVLTASIFVVFVLWLAASRFGNIPLGKDGEKPAFKTWSWISMMFAAGMGIGLMFWGAAEPLYHYVNPPPGTVDGQTAEAARIAMATSLFHWTLHPWAMYAVVGMAMGYGTYRMGRRQLLSDIFTPLFGKKAVNGAGGKIINMLAIFATLFGSAASLGLGAIQIASGLQANGAMAQPSAVIYVVIIAVLTCAFVASAVSGIERGIQWLSNINMVLAAILAFLVFVAGPTIFILNVIPTAVGEYFQDLPGMASRTAASGGPEMSAWLSSWTIFYWAWWISWTPFVGMFIARISKGRTIRQFVVYVILVPSVVSFVWFSILAGSAFDLQLTGVKDLGAVLADEGTESALFATLREYPLSSITVVLAVFLVAIFFITGADSASIVMGMLSQHGEEHPMRWLVIFWGVAQGAVAAVLLFSGGLKALQTLVIIVAGPFMIVICAMCVSLMKALRQEPYESTLPPRVRRAVLHAQRYDTMENHSVALAALGADPVEVTPDEDTAPETAGDQGATERPGSSA